MTNSPTILSERKLNKLIGQRIMFFRREQKMGRQYLAKEIGIDKRRIANYEKGKRKITVDRLILISHILHINISHFFPNAVLKDYCHKEI